MTSKDYKLASREKLAANAAKIPESWRLAPSYLIDVNANSQLNVLHVPRECGILTDKDIDITENYDATDLIKLIASKHLGSFEVVLAIYKRAAIAHQLVSQHARILPDHI